MQSNNICVINGLSNYINIIHCKKNYEIHMLTVHKTSHATALKN